MTRLYLANVIAYCLGAALERGAHEFEPFSVTDEYVCGLISTGALYIHRN